MWEKDYDYLQNKLSYSMGIDVSIMGNDISSVYIIDHIGMIKDTKTTNGKGDMYDTMLDVVKKMYDVVLPKEHTLLTIKNTDRLLVKNPKLEILKNPNRYDEYYIIYSVGGIVDATTFEYKQFPQIKLILKRIPNSKRTYTMMGTQLKSNNTVELKLSIDDIKNIDIFDEKVMKLVSDIANN